MKGFLAVFALCAISISGFAQAILENNPSSLKWNQLNTGNFRILFPAGFEEQAQRMANTLEELREPEARTLGRTPRKINVVLQNQSSLSNGFVSYLPRRTEFYAMPPQDYNFIGNNDWLTMLASHEYRHVVQYRHAARGFNKLVYFLFGGTTFIGMSHLAAPQWFWEGDAVATETAFTRSGRGKIPQFDLVLRTNLLEGRTFNYHKQYLRSYKHYIPDHYVLGYHMVSQLRRRTGDAQIWNKVTRRAWQVPFIPFTFSNALHRETGRYVTGVYNDVANDLRKEWQAQIDTLELTSFERISYRESDAFTDYKYPQVTADGTLLAMKEGIGDIQQFVRFGPDRAPTIHVPGPVNDGGMLSAAAGMIAWAEYGYDPRWLVKNYSRVKVHAINTGKTWTLGDGKSRFSAPALSPKGDKVVCIRSTTKYRHEVVVLDATSGNLLTVFDNADNNFYSMPRWTHSGSDIVVLETSAAGKAVTLLNPDEGTRRHLLPPSSENIGHPVVYGNYLLFSSPVSGIDNIYAFDLENHRRFQVTTSRYGAYSPIVSPDGKWIYYNDQSRDGLDVVRIRFEPAAWKPYLAPPANPMSLSATLVAQEQGDAYWQPVETARRFDVKRYHRIAGMFNPYTWGPYVSNDLVQVNAGIYSRDVLSTFEFNAGFFYDLSEETSGWKATASYQGFYPIIDLNVSSGDRVDKRYSFGNDVRFEWKESSIEGGLRLPFLLTRSKYHRQLTLGNAVGLTRTSRFLNTVERDGETIYRGRERQVPTGDSTSVYIFKDQLNNGDLAYNHASLSFYNLLKRSSRDFLYRWGQMLDIHYLSTLPGSDLQGRQFSATSTLYFPGLFKHHFLYTRLSYQKSLQGMETDLYSFRNRIAKPRGYDYPDDGKFWSVSFNYAFPVWYPDLALGPILNIQRIKMNAFFDLGRGQGELYSYLPDGRPYGMSMWNDRYQSFGVETSMDFNLFRLLQKAEVGVRTTYRMANEYDAAGSVIEFFIGSIGF